MRHTLSRFFSNLFVNFNLVFISFVSCVWLCFDSVTASISIGQPISNQFVGCDYYQTLELNQWHDVFSPRFPQNYPPNTFCRWTACAPYGSVIVVNCTVMRIPSVSTTNYHRNEEFCQEIETLIRSRALVDLSPNLAVAIVSKSHWQDVRI